MWCWRKGLVRLCVTLFYSVRECTDCGQLCINFKKGIAPFFGTCSCSPQLSHHMAGMDAQIPVHATFFLQSPKWCHSVKRADTPEQEEGTCSITRQVCFSHRGFPGSVSIFLIGESACVQRGSALAACRAVRARRRSSYCAINRRRSRLEGCVLCHSAQHMLQKHSFCSSDCAARHSCQRGKGKVNHHTLNQFPLVPSALDILEESWAGALETCQTRGMAAVCWHCGSKSGDGRGGGAGPLHWHEAVTTAELRLAAAAKLHRGFTLTALRCRKCSCSFAPSAEMECHVGLH